MRTLLRHAPTGLYVQSAAMWTGNGDEALDFKLMGQAIRFVEQEGFSKMELVFVSDHLNGFTAVPLATLWSNPSVRNHREPPV
jgi:hypothetical protein